MTEEERRLQVSLRLKAARYLAGFRGPKGATPLPTRDLAEHPALIDEGIGHNRLQELEQMKAGALRRDLDAVVKALGLPVDWFAGLYPADRGQVVSGSLGALLRAIAEAAQAQRRGEGGSRPGPDASDPPPAARGGA